MAVNRVLSARLGQPGTAETTVPLLPAEAIGVDAAVDAFTRGVAYVNHEEDVAGTLEPGKVADFAVLDQDLYAIPPSAIGDTSVALTIARRPGRARRRVTAAAPFAMTRGGPGGDARVNTPPPPVTCVPLMCCI